MKKLLVGFLFVLLLLFTSRPSVATPPPGTAPVYKNATATNTAALALVGIHQLVGYNLSNVNTATIYVQFFDAATAGAVTVGTTPPYFWLAIPAGGGVTDGLQGFGPGFSLGCVVAVTTTPTGGTAPASSAPIVLFFN